MNYKKVETQVTVYHHLVLNVDSMNEKPIVYPVAQMNDVDLEQAFESTNTIFESWVRGRDEGMMIMLRSTSVGDLVKVRSESGEKWFVVASRGYEEADPNDYVIAAPMMQESAEIYRNSESWRESAKRSIF